jgi:anti-sigma factor RsiW
VSECGEIRTLIGAHLLGGLDEDEERVLFAHLARCDECREKHDELARLVPLVERAGPIEESPALPEQTTDRLLAGMEEAASPPRRGGETARRWAPALAGVLVGVLGTLGVVAALGALGGSGSSPRAATSIRLDPTLEAPTAAAMVYVINQNNRATIALEAHGLPKPRPGEQYVVWLSGDHGSYVIGSLRVSAMGWATAILRVPHATWPGTHVSILATPGTNEMGRPARLLAQGTL